MKNLKWSVYLFVCLVFLLTCFTLACSKPDDKLNDQLEPTIHISIEQDRITFVVTTGDNILSKSIEIYSSAKNDPLLWSSRDNATWLEVQPDGGYF